ncbi:MAG TPA: hypothetical protein PK052_00345 [Anaerohalosphaeraceae bacterium]|nr:hypothetical protein [Anaerohalosphaeraceae bacterium]
MNDTPKPEIEELLSALIDEDASERQKTEFKRLLQHEPALADQLAALRHQKQLLNALPIEPAPESLLADIKAAMERNLILGDYRESSRSVMGAGNLLLRRILTVAAMLLLPLGLLGVVVFEILKPPAEISSYVPAKQTLADEHTASSLPSVPAAPTPPFEGFLVFKTSQPMAVGNFIEKKVFDIGLIRFMVPNRIDDTMTYQITAPAEKIAELVDALQPVWPRCEQVILNVYNSANKQTIEIPNLQPEQISTLAREDSPELLARLAVRYASANLKRDDSYAGRPAGIENQLSDNIYPELNPPILTGRYAPNQTTPVLEQPVKLHISVKRNAE